VVAASRRTEHLVSILLSSKVGTPSGAPEAGWFARRQARLRDRRRLGQQDALSVRLVELHQMRTVLAEAGELVGAGWIQNAWFAVVDEQGRHHRLIGAEVGRASGRPVSGVCLVGGIVHAAGGPDAATSQLVQRTLDLTWHTLHESARRPVQWCPAPEIRLAHLRDLTRWNDHPRRTSGEVRGLLAAAGVTVDRQVALTRAP
jgi:hypothetical protein